MSPSGRSRFSGTDRSSRPCTVLVIPPAEVSDCEGSAFDEERVKESVDPKKVSIIEKLKRRQMLAPGTMKSRLFFQGQGLM